MCPDPAPEGTVSPDELNRLAELFRQFEGAAAPLSVPCREAESEFNSLVEKIYHEKVAPAFTSITLLKFRSHTRNLCRLRISREAPPFPCV
jgi:type IV secretory pathway ATPase VirB11/archaellum biosynthesis ATPase